MIAQYMKTTEGHLEGLEKFHEEAQKLNEASHQELEDANWTNF